MDLFINLYVRCHTPGLCRSVQFRLYLNNSSPFFDKDEPNKYVSLQQCCETGSALVFQAWSLQNKSSPKTRMQPYCISVIYEYLTCIIMSICYICGYFTVIYLLPLEIVACM